MGWEGSLSELHQPGALSWGSLCSQEEQRCMGHLQIEGRGLGYHLGKSFQVFPGGRALPMMKSKGEPQYPKQMKEDQLSLETGDGSQR